MKSGTRALIVSIALFLLWGTILTGPFRYFAYAFRDFIIWVTDLTHLSAVASAFVVVVLLTLITIGLLLLGHKKFVEYMAGFCALLSMLYYLFTCIRAKSFDSASFTVTVGLALALLFLIFQWRKASLWLADAYIFSLPVLLCFELVLTPVFTTFGLSNTILSPLLLIPEDSIALGIGDFLHLPMLVWSLFLFALSIIPVIFFSKGRKRS